MRKILLISFLFFLMAFRSGDYMLINTISSEASFMTTDNLGNVYLVVNNELKKYDPDGNLLKSFSDKAHGAIAFADVSDPLTIMIYYKDFRQILFLDNFLSAKGDAVLLDNLNLFQPSLACNSYDNGFWVYDQQDFQLIRFDKNLNVANQSGNIVQLTGIEIKPNFLMEISDKVYLNDPESGILVFDKFGTYAKMLPIKNLTSFQIIDDNIIYATETQLIMYNFKTFEQQSMILPVKNSVNTRFEKDRIYVKDSTSVKIYSVK
jgi:hypothetical protein